MVEQATAPAGETGKMNIFIRFYQVIIDCHVYDVHSIGELERNP